MSNRRGFTTQEPWIPLVIVSLLALVAFGVLRSFGHDARLRALLEHDLGMVALAQAEHHRRFHAYAPRLGAHGDSATVAAAPDSTNTITILHADSAGWAATGTNRNIHGALRTCGIYGGSGPAPGVAVTRPDKVSCW